jgi:type I restriction enzyme S subunit
MELSKGYKQTEVGVIPEDWEVKTIGEVLKIKHGKDQKHVQSENGIYPIFGTGGLMGFARTFLYDKESVLIGRKGTINKPKYINIPFWTVDTLFYSEVDANYLAKYIYYNFLMIDWYSYNEASGVPSLNAKTIENIFLGLPPTKSEQIEITNALNDADNLIDNLEKLIEKKKNIKQGAMQQLLKPKIGWIATTLGEILDVITDYTANGSFESLKSMVTYYNETNYAVLVRTTDLGKDVFVPRRFTDKKGYEYLSKTSLVGGEIVIANVGSLGKVFRVPKFDSPMTLAPNTYLLKFKDSIWEDFIFQWLSAKEFYSKLLSKIGSSTLQAINKDSLRSIVLSIPNNIKEQNEISTILTDMDNEIDLLEKKLSKSKLIKQGMMQNLLTGKIRLVCQK